MVPDLDLQLQSSIKALQDIVAPAIDPGNKMAAEQLQLTIATLAMVRLRLPMARRFTRRLLEDALGMAEAVQAQAEGSSLGPVIEQGRGALAAPEIDTDEIEAVRAKLNSAIANVIAGAAAGPAAAALGKIIVAAAKQPIERQRAWCLPSGFEAYPEQVPAVETVL